MRGIGMLDTFSKILYIVERIKNEIQEDPRTMDLGPLLSIALHNIKFVTINGLQYI